MAYIPPSSVVTVGSILTLATDQSVLGAISSTQSVSLPINGQAAVGIYVPAGFTGTLTPQLSIDGVNFVNTTMISVTSGAIITSTAANGTWQAQTSGANTFRISGNVTAGVASVLLRASQAPATLMLDNPIPAGSNTIGNVGINGGSNNIGSINIRDTAGNILTATNGALEVSVMGAVTINPASISGTVGASVIGTVPIVQSGTIIASLVSTIPSSVIVGTSIFGQLPAGTAPLGSVATLQGTNPWIVTGSVQAAVSGSVAATVNNTVTVVSSISGGLFPIAGSVAATITNTNVNVSGSVAAFVVGNASLITLVQGSVAAAQTGTQITSVISSNPSSLLTGVYAQRNDTVASALGADLTWRPLATDSAGRNLGKPFAADESRLDTASSTVSTSVTALFNSVAGLRNYVTDVMIANTGASATLVTFKDGSTSILGYTIAPAGGGSNINGMAFPMRTAPGQDFVYVNATATSVLYVTAKGYKAP